MTKWNDFLLFKLINRATYNAKFMGWQWDIVTMAINLMHDHSFKFIVNTFIVIPPLIMIALSINLVHRKVINLNSLQKLTLGGCLTSQWCHLIPWSPMGPFYAFENVYTVTYLVNTYIKCSSFQLAVKIMYCVSIIAQNTNEKGVNQFVITFLQQLLFYATIVAESQNICLFVYWFFLLVWNY